MEEEKYPDKLQIMMRDPWIVLGAVGILIVVVVALASASHLFSKKKAQANLGPAPGFTLTDQLGQLTSLAQFRGKVVLLTFIDPQCRQLCPLTTQSMVEAVKLLGPGAASKVQLLGIDANPLKTKVSDVADYTRTHDLQGRWLFLTGSLPQLKQIWRSYHVYVAVVHNNIEHTAVVYLIDQRGDERSLYTTPMSYEGIGDQAQTLAQGVAHLLPGHPAVEASRATAQLTRGQPKQKGTLDFTALGAKQERVVLGGAHPHLVVFFAAWLGQNSNLSKDLGPLDRYAALARRQGWPSPVAVDVMTTEPSPAEAQKVLDPLASSLDAPIVEDKTGRLADGYKVEDLPWFVLNSPSGKILWHHDGWISAAALDKQVRAALAHS